ncbi:MAG: ACT domain-containing protein [Candidatus ainarchaeum sp.]|nr:ACT domain-containing protein [Candidatus ainarchaeum sp.]
MIREIILLAKDRLGLVADISYVLAKEKINIEQISANVVDGKTIIMLGVLSAKHEKAKSALERNGFEILPSKSLGVKLEDRPGALADVSRSLAEAKVNVLNIHILGKCEGNVYDSIVVDRPKEARKVLGSAIVENE